MIYLIDHQDSFTFNLAHLLANFDEVYVSNYFEINKNKLHQSSMIVFSPGPGGPRDYPKSSSIQFEESGQTELLPIGSWEVLKTGADIVLLCVGPVVFNALESSKRMEKKGIDCEVVNCRFIKPMDNSYLQNILEKFKYVITIEEGVITGGFGDGVASWLMERGFDGKLKRLGLPDKFVEHGTRDQLLQLLGLDRKGITTAIQKLIPETAPVLNV